MKSRVLLIVAVCLCGSLGCGRGEINRLTEQTETLAKQVEIEKSKGEQSSRKLKEVESRLEAIGKEKGRLDDLMKERPTLEALDAVRKENKRLAAEHAKEKDRLETELKAAKGKVKLVQDDAQQKVRNLENDLGVEKKRALSAQEEAAAAAAKAKNLERDLAEEKKVTAALKKETEELRPNASVVGKLDAYAPKKGSLIVGYEKGKAKEAEQFCKVLGLEVIEVESEKDGSSIVCQYKRPITTEMLKLLSDYRSVINYVSPNRARRRSSSGNRLRLPRAHGQVFENRDTGKAGSGTRSSDSDAGSYLEKRWGLVAINAPTAWDAMGPSAAADPPVVAVIDYGFDVNHRDLERHLSDKCMAFYATGPRSRNISPDLKDDEGNESPISELAHGTHCAGIILSVANKRLGKDGTNVRLLLLKIDGSDWSIAKAIDYAIENQARVISLSVDWDKGNGYHPRIYRAIRKATQNTNGHDILVVCAAGNNKQDIDAEENFHIPACYGRKYENADKREQGYKDLFKDSTEQGVVDVSRIITVGSIERGNQRSTKFSNFGLQTVDIFAPGGYGRYDPIPKDLSHNSWREEIYSMIPSLIRTDNWANPLIIDRSPGAQYACLWGTSQSTPYVAGAAALLLSHPKYQNLSAHKIKEKLLKTRQRITASLPAASGKPILDLSFVEDELVGTPSTGDPKRAAVHFGRGLHLFWSTRTQESLDEFHQAMALQPNNPAHYHFVAFALARLGKQDLATQNFAHALKLEKTVRRVPNWGELVERLQGPARKVISEAREGHLRNVPLPDSQTLWAGWERGEGAASTRASLTTSAR
jgi:subtilisin family serine protease